MGGTPQTEPAKFKLFNLLSYTNKIFRIGKYMSKIKYDKNWGYHNGPPQTRPPRLTIFKHLS